MCSPTTSDWQRHIGEVLEGALLRNLDALVLAIVQSLQEELQKLVSLDQGNRASALAQVKAESVITSGRCSYNIQGCLSQHHHTVVQAPPTVIRNQLRHQRRQQRHAENKDEEIEKANTDKVSRSQSESETASRRKMAVTAHRANPDSPRERSLAPHMIFDWPDAAAASRATAAAAAVRGGAVQKHLHRLQTQLEFTHSTRANTMVTDGQSGGAGAGTGQATSKGLPSLETAFLPSLFSQVQHREEGNKSLPPPLLAVSAQTSGASDWSAQAALRSMSCSAEIIMTGPTEQEGSTASRRVKGGNQQLSRHDTIVTSQKELAESAIAVPEGSHQPEPSRQYPKS